MYFVQNIKKYVKKKLFHLIENKLNRGNNWQSIYLELKKEICKHIEILALVITIKL